MALASYWLDAELRVSNSQLTRDSSRHAPLRGKYEARKNPRSPKASPSKYHKRLPHLTRNRFPLSSRDTGSHDFTLP